MIKALRHGALLPLAIAMSACVTTPPEPALEIAVTIDDLPEHGPVPDGATIHSVGAELIRALRRGGATKAHGFVNGHWTATSPDKEQVLAAWRSAGLPLANHGWAHRNLGELGIAEFEQEVRRNEPLLRRHSAGEDWRWFRFPFLAEGEDPQKRAAARAVLARLGYRVAAVTMDFSDWQWTAPFARCVAAGDDAAIGRMEQAYLAAAREGIAFSRTLGKSIYGRDIPYVLLLHSGAFTARMTPRLLALYRKAGFRFVGLDDAQRDPAYRADNDPALPAAPQGLEGAARARSIPLPPRTSHAAMLEGICRTTSAP